MRSEELRIRRQEELGKGTLHGQLCLHQGLNEELSHQKPQSLSLCT